jgi:hypothetical protein
MGTQKILCAITISKSQVQKRVFPEANMFNTTQVVHFQDEEYKREGIREF